MLSFHVNLISNLILLQYPLIAGSVWKKHKLARLDNGFLVCTGLLNHLFAQQKTVCSNNLSPLYDRHISVLSSATIFQSFEYTDSFSSFTHYITSSCHSLLHIYSLLPTLIFGNNGPFQIAVFHHSFLWIFSSLPNRDR